MTNRTRTILILAGLLLVVFSMAAFVYVLSPVDILRDQAPILPTLLTVPPGGAP